VVETQKAPYGSPERNKLILGMSHKRWQAIRGIAKKPDEESDIQAALKGGARATYQNVEKISGFSLDSLIKLWPHNTTEAQATDRMGFLGTSAGLSFYCGGGEIQSKSDMKWSASYRGIERDLAAFVSDSTEEKLTVSLFAFRDGDVNMSIRPWALQIGGKYVAKVYEDVNEDGRPDGEAVYTGKPVKLKSGGQPIPILFQGHRTHIAVIEQVSEGRSDVSLPDLCLSVKDIEWDDYHNWVMVRVHNTGIAAADFIDVILYEGTPETGREIGRGTLSHLPWPKDLIATTHKLGWSLNVPPEGITLSAVIDPDNKIEELVESNNRVTTLVKPGIAETKAAVPKPASSGGRGGGRGGGGSARGEARGEGSGKGASRSSGRGR
ncbi:CARDB domain-containing protein, partial [Candidatus Hydrogenedentota bacterium]